MCVCVWVGGCVYVCVCVCTSLVDEIRGSQPFTCFEQQGGSACLTVTARRRHCQCMVISGLISQTYPLSAVALE